jgi:phosphoglycolate phosphatase
MIQKYKHIIWDWNGTLLNDTALCVNIINGLLKSKNLDPLTLENYRLIFNFPVKDYYEKAGFNFSEYSFEVIGKQWMDEYELRKGETSLFYGAKDVLSHIKSAGINQSILSAYSHHTLVEIVKYHELGEYFNYITGLDHIYATSKLEIGKELIEKLNCPKEDIVLVGDTIHDYDVANGLGIECILIANGHQSRERLLACNVPILNDIREIIAPTILS